MAFVLSAGEIGRLDPLNGAPSSTAVVAVLQDGKLYKSTVGALQTNVSIDRLSAAGDITTDAYQWNCNTDDGREKNLLELEISVPPTLILFIQARRTGGSAADVTTTLTWYEGV